MGHFANPALESGALDDMFAAVHSNVDDPQRLKIWVRGGQVDEAMTKMAQEGMGIDFPQMGKDIIEARLNELLGGQATDVDIQYDSSPMSSDDAMMQRLDAEKGEFVSRAYSVGEYQIALGELSMHGIAQEGNGV